MLGILKKFITEYSTPAYIIRSLKNEDGVDGRIISYVDRHSYLAEQYKVLRTNLYSLSHQAPLKTIVVTSTQAQEGKSVTSANLAYTLSLDTEKKTLLIDSDFRKPTIYKLFGLPKEPGFTDVLSEKINIEDLIKKPVRGDLYIITSGTSISNPSEFLNSTRMKELIKLLKERFDYIIFDTPPVINVTDASILGSICDGVIFVVRAGVTQKDVIKEAFTMLKHAQANPRACVLTDVTIPFWYRYLSRYKYYYKYRYGYGKPT